MTKERRHYLFRILKLKFPYCEDDFINDCIDEAHKANMEVKDEYTHNDLLEKISFRLHIRNEINKKEAAK